MDNISGLKMHGAMTAVLQRENGDVEVTQKDNIIVNGGFDFICAAIGGTTAAGSANIIGVGTGTTAPDAAQTALVTELLRKQGAYAHTNGTKVFTIQVTFAAGEATGAITEAGVFTATTGGTMLDRVTFAVINKGSGDTLTVTFTFTLS